jgi:diacylglycerol kinase
MYSRSIFQSFKLATQGIKFIVTNERNMKIHLLFAFLAVFGAMYFHIPPIEFIFVVFSIALVFITEAANTGFELLLDFIHGDKFHPDVKILKDVAAGGVLIAAANAFVIGMVIFGPPIWHLFEKLFHVMGS